MIGSPAYPATIYTIVFTIGFWSWLLFEVWVIARKRGAARDRSRDRGSSFLVIFLLAAGMAMGLILPHLAPQLDIRHFFAAFFVAGIVLIFGGILLRFWAIQTLGRFFSTLVTIQDKHQLITSGPYTYLRNPAYTGSLLTLIGFGLGIGNWLSLLVLFAVGVSVFGTRIGLLEERALAQEFGQAFQDYKKKTWALIPFVW